tara:strand:- start:600 stop:998 length:399 start_codon:yes stop_codon:yes gene_type:complete
MATTTATISISSSNMIPGMRMNYYKTATLHKAGGCKGLEKIQSSTKEYTSVSKVELLDQTEVTTDKANKLYIKNLSVDSTEFITVSLTTEELGRLYAGDWMFIPWSGDGTTNIEVQPSVASSMKIEYVLVHE